MFLWVFRAMKKGFIALVLVVALIGLLFYIRGDVNSTASLTQYTQAKKDKENTETESKLHNPRKDKQLPKNQSAPIDEQVQRSWSGSSDDILQQAFQNQAQKLQVKGTGVVRKILADDKKGTRHQRFLLTLASGQTLLIAHNIDLAPRIDHLKEGDTVSFYGQYEWNEEGGVVHWTHKDPQSKHVAGWLKHKGKVYQ